MTASSWLVSGCRSLVPSRLLVSSSGWAHGFRTDAPKIVYCHTPPRWLHCREDYTMGLPAPARLALSALSPALRRWDRAAAHTATRYLANRGVANGLIAPNDNTDPFNLFCYVPPPNSLAGAFNTGYEAYARLYRSCTASAEEALTRLLQEAEKTARDIHSRYAE